MAFVEDLSVFFRDEDFGVSATLTPTSGSPRTVLGIFDAEYLAADAGGQVMISSKTPTFACKTSDTTNAQDGGLAIGADSYRIIEVRPDGTGFTVLILEEI